MRCNKCHSKMMAISRERVMVEMPGDITEGQMADYMGAELSGNFGDWSVTETTFKCEKCGNIIVLMQD